jgi:hypothetical protein
MITATFFDYNVNPHEPCTVLEYESIEEARTKLPEDSTLTSEQVETLIEKRELVIAATAEDEGGKVLLEETSLRTD